MDYLFVWITDCLACCPPCRQRRRPCLQWGLGLLGEREGRVGAQ